jgi:primosomal replication protein N
MATTFNKIIVVGHLIREPELRYTPTGTAVTTFGAATNHRYKTGDVVQEETCFLDVVVFGRQAETMHDYLHKSNQALVEGRLRQHTWEAVDGQEPRRWPSGWCTTSSVCSRQVVCPRGLAMVSRGICLPSWAILAGGFTRRATETKARGPSHAGCRCLGCAMRRSSNSIGASA